MSSILATSSTGAIRTTYDPKFFKAYAPYRFNFLGALAPDYEPNPDTCPYCGNTGTNVNVRGGVECAGCGVPR